MNNRQTSRITQLGLLIIGLISVFMGLYLAGQVFSHKSVLAQNSEILPAGNQGIGQTMPPTGDLNSGKVDDPMALDSKSGSPNSNGINENENLGESFDNKPNFGEPNSELNNVVPNLPMVENSGEYRYEPVGKRDPFRPFRDSRIGVGQLRAASRTPEPLEKFDIKSLEVVAIVWGNEKPKALIQDPEKRVHTGLKGQRIGRNEGFIAEIREGEIVVVELFDINGKTVKESVVLPIRR